MAISGGIWVAIRVPEDHGFRVVTAESLQVSTPYPTRAEQVTEQVTEQVKRLLACLKNEPLSTKAVMQQLGLAHRPTFIQTYLQPALQAGLIEMTQPDSPKSPTQKYRLKT